MAGYSMTPLVKKLGIKPGFNILLINTPENYAELIDQWPENLKIVKFEHAKNVDFIHFFTIEKKSLSIEFPLLKEKLKKEGLLWISWPKGKSKLSKDLNENDIRQIGTGNGLVDVKVCAVDEDWSGLKFMFRKKDR